MHIRLTTNRDRDDVRALHMAAFDESEREVVAQLAVDLLSEEATPETLSLVAEVEGEVVGHVIFSPVTIGIDEDCQGYILAPLGVRTDRQKQRIGSKLIENGMQQLSKSGVDIVFVYGDPKYYGRFGFSVDAAEHYVPPHKLEYPFGWQGIALSEGGARTAPVEIACVAPLSDPALW